MQDLEGVPDKGGDGKVREERGRGLSGWGWGNSGEQLGEPLEGRVPPESERALGTLGAARGSPQGCGWEGRGGVRSGGGRGAGRPGIGPAARVEGLVRGSERAGAGAPAGRRPQGSASLRAPSRPELGEAGGGGSGDCLPERVSMARMAQFWSG